MSLLLTGAKTLTIAGTEMACIEIYTGESYTIPFEFTDGDGNAINCNAWTLSTAAKFYTTDISYTDADTVNVANLVLDIPQPSTGAGTYSANLTAAFTSANTGVGYIYIPADLTGNTGTPNATPVVQLAQNGANSTLVIVTLGVSRTDALSSLVDFNREPIGMIVRYQ